MFPTVLILAAGVGSRLRPLTDSKPKALLPYKGKPMLEHIIEKLAGKGYRRIVVNIHHHAGQIVEYLGKYRGSELEILISDETEQLMDTGGAILHARSLLEGGSAFIVHNVDIYSDIDLGQLYKAHNDSGALATLAVKDRITSRNLLIDENDYLTGWRNNETGEEIIVHDTPVARSLAFSGIHVIGQEIFNMLETPGPFSIMKAYLDLAKQHPIKVHDHSQDKWLDMAKREIFF